MESKIYRPISVDIEVDMDGPREITLFTEPVLEWVLTVREVTLVRGTSPEKRVVGNHSLLQGSLRPGLIGIDPVNAFSVGVLISGFIEGLER